jgi:hypothetical protein
VRLTVQIRRLLNSCLVIAVLTLCTVVPVASAPDTFYIGTWKIVSAMAAPWWDDPIHKPDATEMRTLVGKTVTITAKAIQGPRAVACARTRYEVKDYPADMLFEGAFEEMHTRDSSADPVKIAASVGFRGSSWKTLETGCAVEINYHFIDPATAAFGLNNYIYTLKKQQ